MLHDAAHAIEPAHDLLRTRGSPLEVFVRPCHVALVGASEAEHSVGRTLAENLLACQFGGKVTFVNPKRPMVLGQPCFGSLKEVSTPIDLVVLAVPAASVPSIIDECLLTGVRGAIIISAGFKETGSAGTIRETQIRRQLVGSNLRVIGPNCLGVMSPVTGLNATFAASMATPGRVAFISQSGALLTAILDWSFDENVGFSHIISTGSMLDVGWGDLIDFLGDDANTTSIVIYMESIGNAKAFLSAAREVALQKPIIVIKAGRTEKAAQAAASHTGALAGSDEVLDAAFRRVGVLRVHHISELFNLAEVLAKQPRPSGPKLAIVTNAGGPGVLATDALIEAGGELAILSPTTIEALDRNLPSHWSHANPVDVLGDACPDRFAECVGLVADAPECDGLLVILTPQAMTDPAETARKIANRVAGCEKPILASWMGAAQVAAGIDLLNHAGVPTFDYPDSATRAFQYMWQYSHAVQALYETPGMSGREESDKARGQITALLAHVLSAGRTLLTEPESKQLLVTYGIPTVETQIATSADAAIDRARQIGYPVVLKLLSTTITHKTDVGGVKLNLQSDDEVTAAFAAISESVERSAGAGNFSGVTVQQMIHVEGYELIIGSKADPQFGPVILFGLGGELVEVFQDRALGLPPLNSTLARRMMERTKIYRALQGIRGRGPVDLAALEQLLVRFAELVIEQPRIREIDINPLLASPQGLLALDARVVLHPASLVNDELPQAVIRPYPRQYVDHWERKDGDQFLIRPVRPEDEPLFVQFHRSLSELAVYERYARVMSLSERTVHERLSRMCFIDYDRQMAMVAIDEQSAPPQLAAVARLIKLHNTADGEFAIVVTDAYQHRGLGSHLLARMIAIGRIEKLARIICQINSDNQAMLLMCQRMGFRLEGEISDRTRIAVLDL